MRDWTKRKMPDRFLDAIRVRAYGEDGDAFSSYGKLGGPGTSGAGVVVSGPAVPRQDEAQAAPNGMVPFRRATTFRTSRLQTTTRTMLTSSIIVDETLEGTGFASAINLEVVCTTAANAAATAFQEDGPWSALDTVVFRDNNGELFNLSGFHLYLLNLYTGFLPGGLHSASADTTIWQKVTGAGATGGSFRFHLYVPLAINRRSLIGVVGNQDQAVKFSLRTDLAASTAVYSTAPTALGSVNIKRTYENYAVPQPVNAEGDAQEQLPPYWGALHFGTQSVNAYLPTGGSKINHYLPRIQNTIRVLVLVLRSNGSRATAEANLPTEISFLLGDTNIFTEDVNYRRRVMLDRFGFDALAGVIAYDFITDIWLRAGAELGYDYLWANGLPNARFDLTYPSGFGSTNNSLTIITDDLVVPDNVNIYAGM